jgi:hypothetical protein
MIGSVQFREFFEEAASRSPWVVVNVATADEGLSIARVIQPIAICVDGQMPNAWVAVRVLTALIKAPLVIVVNAVTSAIEARAKSLGVRAVALQPAHPEALSHIVSHAVTKVGMNSDPECDGCPKQSGNSPYPRKSRNEGQMIADTVRRIAVRSLSVLMLAVLAVSSAFAQTEAGIIGQVTDESGASLPGVTITVTGPALQVPSMVAVTDSRGEYRVSPLPIGTFAVTYELPGFTTAKRDQIRLTQGFVAKLDIVLKVGGVEETITVSGASPVVDVTSAAAATHLTRETLEAIPTGRNGVVSLAAQTPGVRANLDVGGTAMVGVPAFRAFAQTGDSWQTLDGIVMSSMQDLAVGNYIDYTAMEEARIDTIAKGADAPGRGIAISSIVKSGSNDFHGSGFYGQTRPALQGKNVDAALQAQGITGQNKIANRLDVSGELGGRLIKDTLWFYDAARYRTIDEQVPGVFQQDGSQGIHSQGQGFSTTKVSWQATNNNRLIGFYQRAYKAEVAGSPVINQFTNWESRNDLKFYNNIYKAEWQTVVGKSLTTSVQVGEFRQVSPWTGDSTAVPTFDIATLRVTGDSTMDGFKYHVTVHDPKGSLTWYRPGVVGGNHTFKAGFDYVDTTLSSSFKRLPTGNYRLLFNNGTPFQIQTYSRPVLPESVVHYPAFYGSDTWAIGRRLTLNLGLRLERMNGFVPPQCRDASDFAPATCFASVQLKIWNSVAPRMFVTYDLRGDAKAVVKGGWARYNHLRTSTPEVDSTNRNTSQTTTWRWHDLNNDGNYQPGEVNLDPNGSDFVSLAGVTNSIPNPDEIEPKTDEVSASFETEIMKNFGLRVTGVYSKTRNTYLVGGVQRPYGAYSIPVTVSDPGPDGRLGTADDPGTVLTYYEFSTSLRGLQNSQTWLINPAGANQTYSSVEIAANRRLSRNWAVMASYSATKKDIPLGTGTSSYDPNTLQNVADKTWEWTGKVSGTYIFPHQLVASANLESRSGDVYGRQVLATGGLTIPSVLLTVEPVGTRQQPTINLLDFRLEKRLALSSGNELQLRFNLFNLLNSNAATAVNRQSGQTFGYATAILPPRVGEVNIAFKF